MGGKKANGKNSIGRALIKSMNKPRRFDNSSRHTTVLDDGMERLNLRSVTEYTQLEQILDHRSVAMEHYQPVRVTMVKPMQDEVVVRGSELAQLEEAQNRNRFLLSIPRRPEWHRDMTKDELGLRERDEFSRWRRQLAALQEEEGLLLTPYEHNLEFWRQLWRVIERSDVLVQIVDARNPLLFRCEDLERYVKETDERKQNMILMNKSDFLTESQRKQWAAYFQSVDLPVLFFSALQESEKEQDDKVEEDTSPEALEQAIREGSLLTREQLIAYLRTTTVGKPTLKPGVTTIGLVGYPNIGKSSTINALVQCKAVSVSSTPGKTKHFQTLFLEPTLCLCDCPGLVFPSFVNTKAELVINGIMPVDNITHYMKVFTLLAAMIPRHVFESVCKMVVDCPRDTGVDNTYATAEEILNALALARGHMTPRGPDRGWAAREILKKFLDGTLLHCKAPPEVDQDTYHPYPPPQTLQTSKKPADLSKMEKDFFLEVVQVPVASAHYKSLSMGMDGAPQPHKSWKKNMKRPKREKLRRIYKDD